jgi:hypothetical protein
MTEDKGKKQSEEQSLEKNEIRNEPAAKEAPTPVLKQLNATTALEEIEMMIMKDGERSSFGFSQLSEKQKDKVLDLMEKNEENAFTYHREKLKTTERLKSKALDASITNQKTLRYIAFMLILGIFILLMLVLFLKEDYFIPCLSFVTGLCGGAGIREAFSRFGKKFDPVDTHPDSD